MGKELLAPQLLLGAPLPQDAGLKHVQGLVGHAASRLEIQYAAAVGVVVELAQAAEIAGKIALNLEVLREAHLPSALNVVTLAEYLDRASVALQALRNRAIHLIVAGFDRESPCRLLLDICHDIGDIKLFGFFARVHRRVVYLEEQHLRESPHEDCGAFEGALVVLEW